MNNFYYYNPTKVLVGPGMLKNIPREVGTDERILLVYGSESARVTGVVRQLDALLGDRIVARFGSVRANPDIKQCREAIAVGREARANLIIGAGGGSVIDAAKCMAIGLPAGDDPWEYISQQKKDTPKAAPYIAISTLPATGSEFNNACVISHRDESLKLSYSSISLYPRASVIDTDLTRTLGQRQWALAIADSMMHILEQYLTDVTRAPVQERFAEGLLVTIIEFAQICLERTPETENITDFAWAASLASSGILSRGVPADWSTHAIGHELTALYGIPHAESLSVIFSGVFSCAYSIKRRKLAQYGERVWGLTGSVDAQARGAIEKTTALFKSLGLATRPSDLGLNPESMGATIVKRLSERHQLPLGEAAQFNESQLLEVFSHYSEEKMQ